MIKTLFGICIGSIVTWLAVDNARTHEKLDNLMRACEEAVEGV